jgi:hypothetical protein
METVEGDIVIDATGFVVLLELLLQPTQRPRLRTEKRAATI